MTHVPLSSRRKRTATVAQAHDATLVPEPECILFVVNCSRGVTPRMFVVPTHLLADDMHDLEALLDRENDEHAFDDPNTVVGGIGLRLGVAHRDDDNNDDGDLLAYEKKNAAFSGNIRGVILGSCD